LDIPLSAPDVSELERGYVQTALEAGWISGTGAFVSRFEEALSERVGRAHTIAVGNGTLGLELALRGLGIGPGDEVIVPALTFAAPAMSVMAVGASVVLADIAPGSWTIDPTRARAHMTPATKAIIAVDLLGHPADYAALEQLGPPVVQDAAQAHGARHRGAPVGGQGLCSVFSFHANKAITTGEGGSVSTDVPELAERMRMIANHGMSRDRPYFHPVVGRNLRMTNLAAAFGLGQVERWDELVAARRDVAELYRKLLAGTDARPAPAEPWAEPSCWLHTIRLRDRARVLGQVREAGIDARAVWPALDEQPILAHLAGHFPVARAVSRQAVWLPTSSVMPESQVRYVADKVADAIRSQR
jgi:perosamine synthetase